MLDPDMAMTYLDFVSERHHIWEARQAGEPGPWTEDPILSSKKFTNVFRILDPGSQFVIRELCQPGENIRDTLMRLFLYRHTGRVEVWEYLDVMMGGYPRVGDLDEVLELMKQYRGQGKEARSVFTNAYLVFPQSQVPGTDKIDSIIDLTKRLFTPDSPQDVVVKFARSTSQQDRFAALAGVAGVGDFMAMQILTDWGYSGFVNSDLENEYVMPGPGARKGAKFLAPDWSAQETMRWAHKELQSLGVSIKTPKGTRTPSLMDTQNTLCEFGKFVRYLSAPPASETYTPAHHGQQQPPVLPKHW